jgi:hypothetical protein
MGERWAALTGTMELVPKNPFFLLRAWIWLFLNPECGKPKLLDAHTRIREQPPRPADCLRSPELEVQIVASTCMFHSRIDIQT